MAHITHVIESLVIINVAFLVIRIFADLIRAFCFYQWESKINKMSFEERVTSLEIQYYKQIMESKYNE